MKADPDPSAMDLTVYFTPAQIKDFHAPARAEILYVQLALGFAYYGIPNPASLSYLKTLP